MSGFCTLCSHHVDSFDGLESCPNCGTKKTPCKDSNQVEIKINMHELRILGIWAENWACNTEDNPEHMKEIVYAILHRVKKQLPENLSKIPLSMGEEFMQLKESDVKFETSHKAADSPETGEYYNPDLAGEDNPMGPQ